MRWARPVVTVLFLASGTGWCAAHAAAQDAAAFPPADAAPPAATTAVVLHTNLGDIRVALETRRAPLTANNFLRYVDAQRFDNTTFYRAVNVGEEGTHGLVQGGLKGDRKRAFAPVAHESPAATGLTHLDGTISMARTDPGTATADFFFVVGDLVALDGDPATNDLGYAAFGRVVDGMDIVRTILKLPQSEAGEEQGMKGQMLAVPIKILSVRRQ